jgi:hypothetical protein
MGNKQSIHYKGDLSYVGQTKRRSFHGDGKLYDNVSGDLYNGNFKKGLKEGVGELHFYDGNKYVGNFFKDEIHGNGMYICNNGYVYEGEFVLGYLMGKGKIYDIDGCLLYEGDFINNYPHGFGVSYHNNKIKYVGKWNQNLYHGCGILYENGNPMYGLFVEGELVEKLNKIPSQLVSLLKQHKLYDPNVNLTNLVENVEVEYVPKNNNDNNKVQLFSPINNPINRPKTTFNPLRARMAKIIKE